MTLLIKTVSDSREAQRDLDALGRSVSSIESRLDGFSNRLTRAFQIIGGSLGLGLAIKSAASLSDRFTELENKIRSTVDTQEEFNFAMNKLRETAVQTRSSIAGISALYARIALNSKDIGINQTDIIRVTSTVAKTLKLSGASATEAASSLTQFAQAVGSSKLAGDELKSILENNGVLAKVIADGFGVSVGKLKELGEEGKLITRDLLKGVLAQSDALDVKFSKLKITLGDAFSNVGFASSVLLDSLSKAVLGNTGSLASGIDSIAQKILFLANNLELFIFNIKSDILLFVFDSIELFNTLYESLKEWSLKTSRLLLESFENVLPGIGGFFSTFAKTFTTLSEGLYGGFSLLFKSIFSGESIRGSIGSFAQVAGDLLSSSFNSIKISFASIDFSKVFKSLAPVTNFISEWVRKIDSLFAWLYDRVIGNSWVPDLVDGVISWFSKLVNAPKTAVKDLVTFAEKSFESLYTSFKGLFTKTTTIKLKTPKTPEFRKQNIEDTNDILIYQLEKLLGGTSPIIRTLKQVFGVHDSVPGSIFGYQIDTSKEARVGRGRERRYDDRTFGHDAINALPQQYQLPAIAAITGVFALAITQAFSAGTVRSVLLSVLTTVAAVAAGRIVHSTTIRNTFSSYANTFLSLVSRGFEELLGGNAAKDPLGLLSFLAKTAILFEAGRKALVNASIAIATAPTNLAQTLGKVGDKFVLDKAVKNADKRIIEVPAALQQKQLKATLAQTKAINDLKNLTDKSGNKITDTAAREAITKRDVSNFAFAAQKQASESVARALQAEKLLKASNDGLAKFSKELPGLQASRDNAAKLSADLKTSLEESKQRFIQGSKNTVSAAGGVVGGIAGLQIGTEIAKGMANSPEWQKLAVTLGSSVLGQAAGSGIGYAVASSIIGAITQGSKILQRTILLATGAAHPFVAGATILFAGLYAGYKLFEVLPEKWKNKFLTLDLFGQSNENTKAAMAALQSNPKTANLTNYEAFSLVAAGLREAISEALTNSLDKFAAKFLPKPRATEYKASGGIIKGPGSGTSDSIPAMLSNGEYVVNANATKRYGSLLERINSGESVRFFQNGGSVGQLTKTTTGDVIPVAVVSDTASSTLVDKLEKAIGFKLPDSIRKLEKTVGGYLGATTTKEDKGPAEPATLKSRIESAKTIDDSLKLLSKGLSDTGVKLDVKSLSAVSSKVYSDLAEAVDKVERFSKIAAKNPNTFIGRQSAEMASEGRTLIDKLLSGAKIPFEKSSKFSTDAAEIDEKDLVRFGDQFRIISEAFPKIQLSLEEFYRIPDSLRDNIFKQASGLLSREKSLNETPLGLPGNEKGLPGAAATRDSIEKDRAILQVVANKEIEALRSPFEIFKNKLEDINLNVTEELYNLLSTTDIDAIAGITARLKDAYKVLKAPSTDISVTPEMRNFAAKTVIRQTEAMEQALSDALNNVSQNYRSVNNALQSYGLEISKEMFNRLTNTERAALTDFLRSLRTAADTARDTDSDAIRAAANKTVEALQRNFGKFIESRVDNQKIAGEDFSKNTAGSFKSSLSGVLKGERKDGESAFTAFRDGFLNSFTSNVIDTIVNGLTQTLFSGALSSMFEKLGAGLFGLGSGDGLVPDMFGKTPLTPLYVKQVDDLMGVGDAAINGLDLAPGDTKMGAGGGAGGGVFSKMLGGVKSLFKDFDLSKMLGGIGNFFKTGLSSLTSFFGFADGGKISGRGTGTSDSIPALLSNGEFVVNAQSTKRFEPLLRSINNGTFGKFATGGLVGATVGNLGDMQIEPSGGNSTVVNLTITGDISRQTKSTIYEMLPQIAAGVNKRNREKG